MPNDWMPYAGQATQMRPKPAPMSGSEKLEDMRRALARGLRRMTGRAEPNADGSVPVKVVDPSRAVRG